MDIVLEAGAEDMELDDSSFSVTTSPSDFEIVKEAIDAAGIGIENAEITMIPNNTVKVEKKTAEQLLKMMEKLDDHEDIQNVYSDFDIPDEVMEQFS